ncbi:MAG: hypothetical protein JNJ75_10740 [Cyclobacteriaceae bacterium]|nr:hypothetical protein [Cyclobacteriaceae bacterium]
MTDPTIQKLIDLLKRYPGVKYYVSPNSFTVEPTNEKGFAVTIDVGPRESIVSSGFWHEHFDKGEEEQALNCFGFMLSDACRLRIDYRGEKPKRWTLEAWVSGNWITDSTMAVFNINFWSPKRTEYLQNDLIKLRSPTSNL